MAPVNTVLAQLLDQPDDELLVMTLWGAIEDEIDELGVHGISSKMLDLHLCMRLATGCDAEGMDGYFDVSPLLWNETLGAVCSVMGEAAAERLRKIGRAFPEGRPPEDDDLRMQQRDELGEDAVAQLNELARDLTDSIAVHRLGGYVRANPRAFVDLRLEEVNIPAAPEGADAESLPSWLESIGAELDGLGRPGGDLGLKLPEQRRDLGALLQQLSDRTELRSLRRLWLRVHGDSCAEDLSPLTRFEELREIDLEGDPRAEHLAQIAHCESLSRVSLACALSDDDLLELATLSQLRSLWLVHPAIQGGALRRFSGLEKLSLQSAKQVDEHLSFLDDLPALVELSLYDARRISDRGLERIASLPNLIVLYLWLDRGRAPRLDASALDPLFESDRLRELSLEQLHLSDDSCGLLATCRSLEHLHVGPASSMTNRGEKLLREGLRHCEFHLAEED